MTRDLSLPQGVLHYPQYLDRPACDQLVSAIRERIAQAPLFAPKMPKTGRPMSVRMSNFGTLGWVTDKEHGYRYQTTHPETGQPWPEIPPLLIELWEKFADYPAPPEACLVNFYDDRAKMGMHQDRDEETFDAPVLSISLGNDCLFRIGNVERGGKTQSLRLLSGDVLLLSGPARLIHHGVDKIYPDTSDLLKSGGRINLTLRRVTAA
ncbi:MAG: alkylated DNA repair dioxygenase [Hyphomicrobiales bacterium]|nr:MAG: alkylated DNA repair dioxygenase [Hyphomicrobiales bacterium]